MTTIILTSVKYSVLVLSSFYAFIRLGKIKLHVLNLIDVLVALIFGAAMGFGFQNARFVVSVTLLVITVLYMFLRYRKPFYNTVILGTVSSAIALLLMVISGIFTVPFTMLSFLVQNEILRDVIAVGGICLVQLVSVFILFAVKRFRSGLSLQKNGVYIEFLLLASVFCIFLTTLFYTYNTNTSLVELIIITVTFCGLSLIISWRKHITGSYRKKVSERNKKLDRGRIEYLETENSELLKHNEELAKIVHRDNKLIPAMVAAVNKISEKCSGDEEVRTLLSQLEALAAEHNRVIDSYNGSSDGLPKSGVFSIDATVRLISSLAIKSGAEAGFTVDGRAVGFFRDNVDLTDLNTVLCDLGENAVISASSNGGQGKVFVELGLTDGGVAQMLVYDNAAPFDEKVIANLGKEKFTTRKSAGGSGIGLNTLFEILPKYRASFRLDELDIKEGYTKRVCVIFDGAGEYSVVTERESVKKILAARSDFYKQTE